MGQSFNCYSKESVEAFDSSESVWTGDADSVADFPDHSREQIWTESHKLSTEVVPLDYPGFGQLSAQRAVLGCCAEGAVLGRCDAMNLPVFHEEAVHEKNLRLPREFLGEVLPMVKNARNPARLLLGNEVLCRAVQTGCLCAELGANSRGELLVGYEGAVAVADGLKQLPNLEEVSLAMRYNCVGEEGAKVLFEGLKPMHKLSRLRLLLGNNSIGTKGGCAAAESLEALQSLRMLELNLWRNGLMVEGVSALFAGLQSLSNLTQLSLNLESNSFGDKGALRLAEGLAKLEILEEVSLNLKANAIGKEGFDAIISSLKSLRNLSSLELDLRHNSWMNNGTEGVAEEFTQLAHVKRVVFEID